MQSSEPVHVHVCANPEDCENLHLCICGIESRTNRHTWTLETLMRYPGFIARDITCAACLVALDKLLEEHS